MEVLPYKEDGTLFRSVTRQLLAEGGAGLPVELRYFEVGPGGHSTLERHEHEHLVVIARGCGRVMVGERISEVSEGDVVQIEPMTWHQFRAAEQAPLGFYCVVHQVRDRPQRPDAATLSELSQSPEIAEFIRF